MMHVNVLKIQKSLLPNLLQLSLDKLLIHLQLKKLNHLLDLQISRRDNLCAENSAKSSLTIDELSKSARRS